ncbi:MAG: hypothetical protein JO307_27850 [Bryobacterales bacterium]|nr:hypothetical protein [Bryobacterales bacterium]
MKSTLLCTALAFINLAGMVSAQGFGQRGPGFNSPGALVNNVTPTQLTQWMQSTNGVSTATVDQWCYGMNQITGYTCPAPENFGFTGWQRTSQVDAQTFLNNLRAYESGVNTAPFATNPGWQNSPGVAACQRAVRDRLRNQGYSDVRISSINAENGRRGSDRVFGSVDAQRQFGRFDRFDFSCGVNLERGNVSSLDLNPR